MPPKKGVDKFSKEKPKKGAKGVKNPFVASPDSLITAEICKNIRSIYLNKKRQEKWTQQDFADYVGVPLPYAKAILQGRFAPSHAVMAQIAKLFGTDMGQLYGLNK